MSYSKLTWKNGSTPINATNLQHMEDGIYDANTKLDSLFKTATYQLTLSSTLAADGYVSATTYNISSKVPNGYKALAVTGVQTSSYRLRPTSYYVSGDTSLYCGYHNCSTSSVSSGNSITFYILCVKE